MSYQTFKISKIGPQGDGIHEGVKGAVFVDRTAPGDIVKGRAFRDTRGARRAKLIKVVQPSTLRQHPPCEYFSKCGNCTLMHLQPRAYRDWKLETLKSTLDFYKVRPQKVDPPLFLDTSKRRRRATFSIYRDDRQLHLGYFDRRSDFLTHIEECLVVDPKIIQVRDRMKSDLFHLMRNEGCIDLFLQLVDEQVDAVLVAHRSQLHGTQDRQKQILERLFRNSGVSRLSLKCPQQKTTVLIAEKERIKKQFGPLSISIPAGAFLQASDRAEAEIVQQVLKDFPKVSTVADLFSGCGTLTGPLSNFSKVVAFELDADAVHALREGANENVMVEKRDLFTSPLSSNELSGFDAVVLDPPRAGAPDQCRQLGRSSVPYIVYVSCNQKTFARDASLLCRSGYKLKRLRLIDQFQWSHHMEVVGVFER